MVRAVKGSVAYILTFLFSFHEDEPEHLVVLQQKHWDPILEWARRTFDVEIKTFDSLLGNSQPEDTRQKFSRVLQKLDPWQLAGMCLFGANPHLLKILLFFQ